MSTSNEIGAKTADLAAFEASTPKAGFPTPGAQVSVTVLGVNDMHAESAGVSSVPYATAKANYAAWLDALAIAGVGCHVLVEIPETTPWGLDQTGPPWNALFTARRAHETSWSSHGRASSHRTPTTSTTAYTKLRQARPRSGQRSRPP